MKREDAEEYVKNYNKELYIKYADCIWKLLSDILPEKLPNVKIASISRRAKEPDSLLKKLEKDKYSKDSEITDLAGIRIILYRESDISSVVKVINDSFSIDKNNSIDKKNVLGEDRFGYRAYHLVVMLNDARRELDEYKSYKGLKAEIQVTTVIAHAWSEITHEKGYKTDGDLPKEMTRRMNLLAGLFEVADLELDTYVDYYDKYVEKKKKDTEKGKLNDSINSITLPMYFKWKFPGLSPCIIRDQSSLFTEIHKYGISTIKELDDIVDTKFSDDVNSSIKEGRWRSIDGLVRNIMIIHDAEKYFDMAWNSRMNQMNKENYNLYVRFGVDIDELCKKYKIKII